MTPAALLQGSSIDVICDTSNPVVTSNASNKPTGIAEPSGSNAHSVITNDSVTLSDAVAMQTAQDRPQQKISKPKKVHWAVDDNKAPSQKKRKLDSAVSVEDLLPRISSYSKALTPKLSDVEREPEKSAKLQGDTLELTAPRFQALYHCFNKHYILQRVTQMAREFATGANIIHISDDASTDQEAILKMIIQYNY